MIKLIRTYSGKPISNTTRVQRTLMLIIYLKEPRNIKESAKHIGVANRSIQRYLNMLTQLGFKIERTHRRKCFFQIVNLEEYFFDKDKIEDFSTITTRTY